MQISNHSSNVNVLRTNTSYENKENVPPKCPEKSDTELKGPHKFSRFQCNALRISEISISNSLERNVLCIQDDVVDNNRKIYFPLYIDTASGLQKRLCFLDSGSDINLLPIELIKTWFTDKEIAKLKIPKRNVNLFSFSNEKITIHYEVKLPITFDKNYEIFESTFAVISPIAGAPHMLCGAPFMRENLFQLKYVGDRSAPVPELVSYKNLSAPKPIETLYLSDN